MIRIANDIEYIIRYRCRRRMAGHAALWREHGRRGIVVFGSLGQTYLEMWLGAGKPQAVL